MHDDAGRAQIRRVDGDQLYVGTFRTRAATRQEFLSAINLDGGSFNGNAGA